MNQKKILSLIVAGIMLLSLCSVFVFAASPDAAACYVQNLMTGLSVAPTLDGSVTEEEWGDPIVITSPTHAQTAWTGGYVPGGGGSAAADQRAKIYMVNDGEYLYLAATLDHTTEDTYSSVSSNATHRAMLALTVSGYEDGAVVQKSDKDHYCLFRVYGKSDMSCLNRTYLGSSNQTSDVPSFKYSTKFANATYAYELRIKWTDIPGFENGVSDAGKVAFTIRLADTAAAANKASSYYSIGGDAATTFSASNHPHADGVLAVTPGDWCRVKTSVSPMPAVAPIIDGSMADGEWGEPVIITSPDHAAATWNKGYQVGQNAVKDSAQRARVYMTNDGEFLYVAASLDHTVEDTYSTVSSNATHRAMFAMTVSKYDNGTTVQKDNKDYYCLFRVYGNKSLNILNRTYIGSANQANDVPYFKHSTSFANGTYTYEMKIRIADIPGFENGFTGQESLALTMRIADTASASNMSSSYYSIGGDAASNFSVADPHADGVLQMKINPPAAEDPYVSDVASAGQNIIVDGRIDQNEWGSAVAVLSPLSDHFFNQDKTHGAVDQRAKIYLSNDEKYIYVGATLDHADAGVPYTGSDPWKYPQFWFTLSTWDDQTTVKRVDGQEQYTSYRINYAAASSCKTLSENIPGVVDLGVEDYKVIYDETSRTYTYEARIPLTATNIHYADSLDVAFSAQVGTALYTASGENDRYNLGLAVANSPAQTNRHEGEDRAVKIMLNKPSWLTEGNYVKDIVAEKTGDIVIDANISAQEWGEPVIVTDPAYAKGYWNPHGYWNSEKTMVNADQEAKIYMTNDTQYLYVAATLDHAGVNVNADAANYGQPQFSITLSQYDANTNVARVNGKEQFSYVRLGWTKGGEVTATTASYQLADFSLSEQDWAVRYDETAQTYIYEVRIPLSATNINLHETSLIAASIQLGDSNYGTNGSENNRYNIGGRGAADRHLANSSNPHENQPVLVMDLRQSYYVKDTASKVPSSITVDGKVTVGEWGDPVIVADPSFAQTIGAYRENDAAATNERQTARMWLTNDTDYIYIAATLDKSADNSGDVLTDIDRPHFSIDLSQCDAENTVKLKDGQEQYTGFTVWIDGEGKEHVLVRTQGLEVKELSEDDHAVSYNAKTDTYTYELRIPYGMTNIDWKTDREIVYSASLGAMPNRYLFSLGCEGSHKDNALRLTLNDPPRVSDTVAPFSGAVTLDGYISSQEWGEPIIVTTPDHCKATWKGYWKNDPSNVNPYQTVKVYSTNDDQYVYFAATIDETDLCTMDGAMWQKAHLFLSIGRYDEKTDMERIVSQKKTYERYVMYRMGFDGSTPKVTATGMSVDRVSIAQDDWVIRYDAESRTYFYELRIPFTMTTLRYGNDDKMQVSIAIADARVSDDATANVYNIGGTGASYGSNKANNFAHTGQSMTLKLNSNPYTMPDNWVPTTQINPMTGDMRIMPILALIGLSGSAVIVLCIRRRIKER